jgi:peptide/nickel transport system substrate-binding protein
MPIEHPRPTPSRMRGYRRYLLPVAALATVGLVAGCAGGKDSSSDNASGGASGSAAGDATAALVLAYSNPLNTLDPIHADYNQTNTITDVIYDTLASYDAKNELKPMLAKSFTLAADAKSVSVTLRDDVKFHDGSPMTAADIKYTFDRDVAVGQGTASYLSNYASTTVTDDTHLTINLKTANSLFIGGLSKLYIIEQKLVTANAGSDNGQTWLQSHDAGSGPYAITTGSGDVVASRFAGYWNFDKGAPATITFRRIDESPTKAAEVKSGDIDIALSLQSADAQSLKGASGVTTANLAVPNGAYIFMNTQTGPTANVAVRKALRLAYDYSGGLSTIRNGAGTIESGPLPQTMSCITTAPAFKQDLSAAKAMLASANITDLHLTMRYQPAITDQAKEATLFQSNLKDIGVTLDLVPIAFADYLASLSSVSTIPQLMLLQDTAALPDSGIYLTKAYDSASTGTNRAAYSNPQVDSLLAQAATSTDTAAQCKDYQQVQTLINADAPSVSMYTLSAPIAYGDKVTGIVASQTVYPFSLRGVHVG